MEENEQRKLVAEAAQIGNRQLPFATVEWLDTHQRRHIGPWPEERKHDGLSLECWCVPVIYRGIAFHFDPLEAE